MGLYELRNRDYKHNTEQSIIIYYDGLIDDQMDRLVSHAQCSIEEYIENDEYDSTMDSLADLYEDGYKLEAIVDYLCEFNGFSRWYPPQTKTIYI